DVAWPLKVDAAATPGKRELKVTFTHQACTNKGCFPPVDTTVSLTLEVLPRVAVGPPLDLPAPRPAHVAFSVAPDKARPGEVVKLTATVFVQNGFHIYAPGSEAGAPTTFEVKAPAGFALEGDLDAPKPTREEDEYGQHAKLWEGTVRLVRAVRVPAAAAPD